MADARTTPLYDLHVEAGAMLTTFAGFKLPVRFSSVQQEHRAVREAAGLFDVSHMGQLQVKGTGARRFLDGLVTVDVSKLPVSRARYGFLCNATGGIIDDLIVYALSDDDIRVICNAANVGAVWEMMAGAPGADAAQLLRLDRGLIALQGPEASEVLSRLWPDAPQLKRFGATVFPVSGDRGLWYARTGYTGEDGFEISCAIGYAPRLWKSLLEVGASLGLVPVGLGARDTLRLEAALPLHGQDISQDTNPFEAGLQRFVDLGKRADFLGRSALERLATSEPNRRLVGLAMRARGIARAGYQVFAEGKLVGRVTSGAPGICTEHAIALAYMSDGAWELGTRVAVEIRGKQVEAEVVETPFYRRPRS